VTEPVPSAGAEVEALLEPGESLLWWGRPRFRDRLAALGAVEGSRPVRAGFERGLKLGCLASGALLLALVAAMLVLQVRFEMMSGRTGASTVATAVAALFAVGGALAVLGVGPATAYRSARDGRYLLTDRRVIVADPGDDAGVALRELRFAGASRALAVEVKRARLGSRVDVLFRSVADDPSSARVSSPAPPAQWLAFVGVGSAEEAERIEGLVEETLAHSRSRSGAHLS